MSFWRRQPMLRGYVSEVDRFLHAFDQRPEATSVSRQAEELKYERISHLRDNAQAKQPSIRNWEEF